jgi:hypothetical protein
MALSASWFGNEDDDDEEEDDDDEDDDEDDDRIGARPGSKTASEMNAIAFCSIRLAAGGTVREEVGKCCAAAAEIAAERAMMRRRARKG